MSKCVAIIPARGGSKRIPGKNIKDFCGKPIIAYSIEAAIKSKLFERVIVSTDSEEIALVAKKYGAEVPFMRSAELSDDYAGTSDVIIDALEKLDYSKNNIELACCIYPTAPFIEQKYLVEGYESLKDSTASIAFAATEFSFPILRGFGIGNDGKAKMFWPEHEQSRSQDLPKAYHDAGQFYWYRVNDYIQTGTFSFNGSIPVIMPQINVQDIDTLEDWEYAETKWEIMRKQKPNE